MLNIIKDYVNNEDLFTGKTAIPQDKFLDLANLVLKTIWYTLNSQFYQHLQPYHKFICRLMNILQYLRHYSLQKFDNTMEEESNGELAFLDTLLKQNNGKISLLVYRKPTHAGQYLHYSSCH